MACRAGLPAILQFDARQQAGDGRDSGNPPSTSDAARCHRHHPSKLIPWRTSERGREVAETAPSPLFVTSEASAKDAALDRSRAQSESPVSYPASERSQAE